MKSRIAKLYNVLVIGGAVAASSACTKDSGKPPDPKDPPAVTTPAKAPDPAPPPAAKDTDATPTEKAAPAVADPTAATTPDDKTKTVKKKGDKAPGSGAKGWS
jgi:hypothetical protein